MNIIFKDWKELPRFNNAGKDVINDGSWSYRNGGFKPGDVGVWYIVNVKPVLTTQKSDYIFTVYQLPPEICCIINEMIADAHNEVIDMVLEGFNKLKRMKNNGLGYIDKEDMEDIDEPEKST